MPVADKSTLHTLISSLQVASSLNICQTARRSTPFANRIRHFSYTKNCKIKAADDRRDLEKSLQGPQTKDENGRINRREIIRIKEFQDNEEHGAMSRRLAQLAETDSIEGSTGRCLVKRLLDRQHDIDDDAYCARNETTATPQIWNGESSIIRSDKVTAAAKAAADAKAKSSVLAAERAKRDGSLSSTSSSTRLANARARSAQYASAKAAMDNLTSSMTPAEKEAYRAELRARFQFSSGKSNGSNTNSGAGGSSNIVTGLASLANERIDAAIAAGAFQKISRGKSVQIKRDHNASSPFIDTTEYLMNRMVQRQAIVPPWIEKQQEIAITASRFRARLRADWRRHAARTIASEGGTLEEQMEKASLYALAEAKKNPRPVHGQCTGNLAQQKEQANEPVSQITVSGEFRTDLHLHASSMSSDSVSDRQGSTMALRQDADKCMSNSASAFSNDSLISNGNQREHKQNINLDHQQGLPEPFRDPAWEAAEQSYHTLQIHALNSLTRTYNLQAPDIAKKPYFSLERELRACYAEVAPQLSEDLRMRALAPRTNARTSMADGSTKTRHASGHLIERMGGGTVPVWEDTRPKYGFKELWKDFLAGFRR